MTSKGGPTLASSLEVIKLKLFFFLKEKKSAFVCAKFATKLRDTMCNYQLQLKNPSVAFALLIILYLLPSAIGTKMKAPTIEKCFREYWLRKDNHVGMLVVDIQQAPIFFFFFYDGNTGFLLQIVVLYLR